MCSEWFCMQRQEYRGRYVACNGGRKCIRSKCVPPTKGLRPRDIRTTLSASDSGVCSSGRVCWWAVAGTVPRNPENPTLVTTRLLVE